VPEPEQQQEDTFPDDGFFVTGQITIQAGMTADGEPQWRWMREDIEPALALGFITVMLDELKADIRQSVQELDEEEDEDGI
jgi:hypothetical protein